MCDIFKFDNFQSLAIKQNSNKESKLKQYLTERPIIAQLTVSLHLESYLLELLINLTNSSDSFTNLEFRIYEFY